MTAPDKVQAYSFRQQMIMSQGVVATASVDAVLLGQIPGAAAVVRAAKKDDRNGTDYWVHVDRSARAISVDAKVLSKDPMEFRKPEDTVPLETWSNKERGNVGWTRDTSKQTDYILWIWTPTKRFALVPFRLLCGVFVENWEAWREQYRTHEQATTRDGRLLYHSECVFVKRRDVWAAIYRKYSGEPKKEEGDES